ncbi:enolase-phosphatase E1 [Drosophila virilis]|uniref:Uncharacterized protein n=1 Tax=Drosophila virilis TaxID=7244 RepID=B4M541_DROVI|nr:uncharacterized protein LOC6632639 [Drosophila virilis]EDW59752.1 uncharacterized protein Dvir_GJ10110 [Drosophila virilis]
MSQNASNLGQQRRPEESSEVQDVSFNSSSEYAEWDRGSYERKKETRPRPDQKYKQKAKFTAYCCLSDDSDPSLYKKCQKRAESYVKQFIAEKDAAANYHLPEDVPIRNFIRKVEPETFTDSKTEFAKYKDLADNKIEGQKKHSAREDLTANEANPREQSDTDISQLSQSSSEESKTFSQIYSEIYEESRARQEKAEQIYRVYTNKESKRKEEKREHYIRSKSGQRTARWVEYLGQPHISNEYSTEGSNESDKDSEYFQSSVNDNYFTEEDYQYLIQEQLHVIARYQQESRSGYNTYIEEYISELAGASDGDQVAIGSQPSHGDAKDSLSEQGDRQSKDQKTHETEPSVVRSSKACSLEFTQKSLKSNNNDIGKTEVLQFEHCDIYHIRPTGNRICSVKKFKKTPVEAVFNDRDERSHQDCTDFEYNKSEDLNNSRKLLKPIEERTSQGSAAKGKADQAELKENAAICSFKRIEERRSRESEKIKIDSPKSSIKSTEERKSRRNIADRKASHCSSCQESFNSKQMEADSLKSSLKPTEERKLRRNVAQRKGDHSKDAKVNGLTDSSKRVDERSSWQSVNTEQIKADSPSSLKSTEDLKFQLGIAKRKADEYKDLKENASIDSSMRVDERNSRETSFTKRSKSQSNCYQSESFVRDVEEPKSQIFKKRCVPCEQSDTDFSKPKSRLPPYNLKKSGKTYNKSHKALQSPTNLNCPSERCTKNFEITPLEAIDSSLLYANEEVSVDDYYLSSKGATSDSSLISTSRSMQSAPKTYQDRASSPIQIIYSEPSDSFEMELDMTPTIQEMEEEIADNEADDEAVVGECHVAMAESERSTKSKLSKECSQTSIASEEKGVQYPSGDELGDSSKKQKRALKIYNLDEALLKVPKDFKGKAIVFDNEDELLDISLSDDDLQLQAKLQAAVWTDATKEGSSNNISCNSLPSGDSRTSSSSSAFSICSYQPSERFYRRTQPEDDDDLKIPEPDMDTQPITYELHVARLAERALRACTDYYQRGVQLKPELEQDIAAKVQMLYNSEMQFNTPKRLIKREEILKQFNLRLQQQLNLIAPSFQ